VIPPVAERSVARFFDDYAGLLTGAADTANDDKLRDVSRHLAAFAF
jgi:hypothetical protein